MANVDSLNRTLFIGDNLPVLRGIDSETIDLIATDPPFNKGVKAFEGIVTAGKGKEGKKVSYKDVWTWGDVQSEWTESIREDHPNLYAVIQAANAAAGEDMGAFLCWLGVRVLEMHRILKPTGSIYLHIDHTAHAYVKAMMDAVFGRGNFRNEIVWYYRKWSAGKYTFQRNHDTLLFYARTSDKGHVFNQLYMPRAASTQKRFGDAKIVSGFAAGGGRLPSVVESEDSDGARLDDVWAIGRVPPIKQRYPTQKPLALYERIITASSN